MPTRYKVLFLVQSGVMLIAVTMRIGIMAREAERRKIEVEGAEREPEDGRAI